MKFDTKLFQKIPFHHIYAGILAIALFCFYLNKNLYSSEESPAIQPSRLFIVTGVFVLLILLIYLKNQLSEKLNNLLSLFWFGLSPFVCFYLLETLNRDLFSVDIFHLKRKLFILLNLVIFYMLLLTFFVITNSFRFSVVILAVTTCVFGLANYYVYHFRGLGIVASDIFSFQTAASVAGNYEFFINYDIFTTILFTLLICTISIKLPPYKLLSPKGRLICSAIYCILLIPFLNVFVYSDQLLEWNINVRLYKPHNEYKYYGTALTTVRTIGYIIVSKPADYNLEELTSLAGSYPGSDTTTEVLPNIIVIMDEALADLKDISDFSTSEDYMPFIRSLSENTIKGNTYVSVFGGNTANTEFEFLTNNTMAFLPTNTVPYQLFIKEPMPSLTTTMEANGYGSLLAMHPYYASGFSRDKVYPLLGFENFISIADYESPEKLRGYITDAEDFKRIIEEYEKSRVQSNDPFYMFNVTMQNHGGYSREDENFQTPITITDEAYNYKTVNQYINLVKLTDTAFQGLVEYFENVDEPTAIVLFGDHKPGVTAEFYDLLYGRKQDELTSEELMEKYKIPFVIWANYDISEEYIEKISINYLSAILLDSLGISTTGYQQYLLDLKEEIPVITSLGYWGKNGEFYETEDTSSQYYSLISQYQMLQYNNVFDTKNRLQNFFTVPAR